MKRNFISTWLGLACCAMMIGCDEPQAIDLSPQNTTAQAPAKNLSPPQSGIPEKSPDNLLVASFNIQVFGVTKAKDDWVMQRLAAIIRLFDVVAVQEIRSQDDGAIRQLINYINADGQRYSYVISERLGRTVSKEQYAYIFDTSRVVSNQNETYVVADGSSSNGQGDQGSQQSPDLLHREPFVARFVSTHPGSPFRFTLIDTHTDPDLAESEVDVLATVYQNVRTFEASTGSEDDVMLMGDFNEAPNKFGHLATIPGLMPAIFDQPSNTAESKLFDNIMIDKYNTFEFTGRSGVLRMREMFGLQISEAKRISDHNPVWAEFSSQERAAPTAMSEQPGLLRR